MNDTTRGGAEIRRNGGRLGLDETASAWWYLFYFYGADGAIQRAARLGV